MPVPGYIAVRVCRHGKVMRPGPGDDASLSVFVTMFQDKVQVFRDVSGTSLHRRGYRGVIHKASLNEAAAAAMLYTADWPQVAKEGAQAAACMSQCCCKAQKLTTPLALRTSVQSKAHSSRCHRTCAARSTSRYPDCRGGPGRLHVRFGNILDRGRAHGA